jgi:hypothetical protein
MFQKYLRASVTSLSDGSDDIELTCTEFVDPGVLDCPLSGLLDKLPYK